MVEFIFIVVWYIAPYVALLLFTYVISAFLLKLVRSIFLSPRKVYISAFSLFIIVATLLSWAFAVDLFLNLPYRPIEFVGQPFIIPNLILLAIAMLFARGQKRRFYTTQELSLTRPTRYENLLMAILVLIAIGLVIFTRVEYVWRMIDEPVAVSFGRLFDSSLLCDAVVGYGGTERCVLAVKSINSGSETQECELFGVHSNDYKECLLERAEMTRNPNDCLLFTYGSTLHLQATCVKTFVDTDVWETTCNELYGDYNHLLVEGRCLTSGNVNSLLIQKGDREFPAWFSDIYGTVPGYNDSAENIRAWLQSISVNPNTLDNHGRTALSFAFINDDKLKVSHVEEILAFGVNPNLEDNEGFDAFDYAISEGTNIDVVLYMLDLNPQYTPTAEVMNRFLENNRYPRERSANQEVINYYLNNNWLRPKGVGLESATP